MGDDKLRRRFSKILMIIASVVIIGFGSICGMLASDSSSYLFLMANNQNYVNKDAQPSEIIKILKRIYGTGAEESTGSAEGHGSGVNLMLIAEMNENYAKEMLTLYKDLQEGKVTEKDSVFIDVSTLLGMQTNETGTYDGVLPKTYLPYKNKKVVWNTDYLSLSADQMTIRGFGDDEWEALGGGLCSWLSEGVDSASDRTPWCMQGSMITLAKSTINGVSNANRKKAQQHYIPDNIASINRRLNNFIDRYKVDPSTLSSDTASILAANIHNRGEGGVLQCAFGFAYNPYGGTSSSKASKVLKNNKYNLGIGLDNVTNLLSNYVSNNSSDLSDFTSSSWGRLIFSAIAAHSDNWFFSQDAYNYLNGKRSSFLQVWKALYPKEKVDTNDIMNIVHGKVKNLNAAIKSVSGESLTSAETNEIYNTANDYSDCDYAHDRGWGVVYCVVNQKITYADGKKHTLVSAYDMVGGGYLVSASMIGKYVYAKMLKVSGVGVDPTNPQTYLNKLEGSDTYVPGGSAGNVGNASASLDPKVSAWLTEIGLSYNKLTAKQVTLFESIYRRLGIPYKSCRHNDGCDGYCYDSNNPSHLDAGTFIWKVFNDANLKTNSLTCSSFLKDTSFERIAWADRKPGDILVTLGEEKEHAMIYVRDQGNTLVVAEAKSGKDTQVTYLARGSTIYADKSGTANTVHYGANGGKKYVLLRCKELAG